MSRIIYQGNGVIITPNLVITAGYNSVIVNNVTVYLPPTMSIEDAMKTIAEQIENGKAVIQLDGYLITESGNVIYLFGTQLYINNSPAVTFPDMATAQEAWKQIVENASKLETPLKKVEELLKELGGEKEETKTEDTETQSSK